MFQTAIFSTVYNTVQLLSILSCGVLSDRATRGRWCATRTTMRKCFEAVCEWCSFDAVDYL